MPAPADPRAGRAAFTHPAFVLFQTARFLIVAAVEMQAVAVGWQVYEITKRPLDLGFVGLAQFLPAILLFPISGHASDRFERRDVLSACYAGFASASPYCSVSRSAACIRSRPSTSFWFCWASSALSMEPPAGPSCRSWFPKNTSPTQSPGTLRLSKPQPFWGH